MKTGIITFSRSINYGAALQATALFRVLRGRGADAYLVDHRCDAIDHASRVFDIKYALKPAYAIPHIVNAPSAVARKRAFCRFMDKYCLFSGDDPKEYGRLIAGSDQVWNYNLTGGDMYYFLDFDKNGIQKLSYAASFGITDIDKEHRDIISPCLADFDRISVREKSGAELVKAMTGIDADVVLDPTLLLDKNEWETLCDSSFDGGRYIFVYTVFNSDTLWDFAYSLSKKTGLPIRTVSYSHFHKKRARYDFTAGPDRWLSYVKNAEYVVTNSFHGVAFSVNFQKQFYYELPPHTSGVGSRISDMASALGFCGRELSEYDGTPLDHSTVAPRLEAARQRSLDYINEITEEK